MKTLRDLTRGIAASFSGHALAALGWTYAGALAVGLAFTVVAYRFVAATVQHSAMAADLRGGQSAGWLVDLIGREGTSASVASLMTVATVLAPVYLVLVIFFSGGVLSKVRAKTPFPEPS